SCALCVPSRSLRVPLPFLLLLRRPRRSTHFPYTTLFRSVAVGADERRQRDALAADIHHQITEDGEGRDRLYLLLRQRGRGRTERSEEHTSELQSRENLVCRLLLEKKNTHKRSHRRRSRLA